MREDRIVTEDGDGWLGQMDRPHVLYKGIRIKDGIGKLNGRKEMMAG